jgi:two-component system, LuxR family, sensor kinase FixL
MRRRTRAGGKSAKPQRRQTLTVPKAARPHPALAATPDALRLVLETALDAVVVMKSDGVVADWNDRAAGVFGWSRDEAVGRTMADLIIPERYREAHRTGLQRYLETGMGSVLGTRIEVAGLKKNGTEFPVELSISPVRNGKSVLFVGCLRDLTERNALRLARGEVSRVTQRLAMGEMAASIVREIGQPLEAIETNANAALRRLAGSARDLDEVCLPLQRVVNDSRRANEVIEKIRLIFNPDSSPQALLDVNNLVREVITLVRGEIENQRVSVRTELANDLPLVSANLSQLQQVIVNLVTNAIEAMHGVADRYRVLRIKTKIYDTRYLLITVEDSGIGIDPKDRDSILEPFVTTKSNRMGMGLSICWSIIANHGGRLAVAPGQPQGSIFQVFLPL